MVNEKEKCIVLIGFMGAGKTTVGKILAAKLNQPFIDVDEELEKEFNMPITQVFMEFGEIKFRDKEKAFIARLCNQGQMVLSLGGGAFLQEDTRTICLSSGNVIFLDISFEHWKERMNSLISSRPILQGKTINEIEDLFNKRQEVYSKHHLKINVDHKEPDVIANQIIEQLIGSEKNG